MKTDLKMDSIRPDVRISGMILLMGAAIGLASFFFYYSVGLTTAHYDAKAHLVVARRIWDSLTPGYAQMGMNWLPLTHLLYLPFVLFDSQYRSGLLPSMLSVLAFCLSGWLVCRIARRITGSLVAGIFASAVLLANQNLQYLQSCPLTEPLAMVLLLLSFDSFLKWRGGAGRTLPWMSALWAALGAACRYEAWYFIGGMLLLLILESRIGAVSRKDAFRAACLYLALFLIPTCLHFGYIYLRLGDSFIHRVAQGNPSPFETYKRPLLSIAYHLAELCQIASILPLLTGFAGVAYCFTSRGRARKYAPLLLLWVPSAVNISALYWGMVYRIRYSVLLLPAIAVFGAIAACRLQPAKALLRAGCLLALALPWITWLTPHEWRYHSFFPAWGAMLLPALALVVFLWADASQRYSWPLLVFCVIWMLVPAIQAENRPILAETLEHQFIEPERKAVIRLLREDYHGSHILIDMLKQAPLAYDTGLPLKEFVSNEGDPSLWKLALSAPDQHTGWVCVQKGDDLWNLLQVDRHWLDKYALALRTENFEVFRLNAVN